jgi:hypothetical protein
VKEILTKFAAAYLYTSSKFFMYLFLVREMMQVAVCPFVLTILQTAEV